MSSPARAHASAPAAGRAAWVPCPSCSSGCLDSSRCPSCGPPARRSPRLICNVKPLCSWPLARRRARRSCVFCCLSQSRGLRVLGAGTLGRPAAEGGSNGANSHGQAQTPRASPSRTPRCLQTGLLRQLWELHALPNRHLLERHHKPEQPEPARLHALPRWCVRRRSSTCAPAGDVGGRGGVSWLRPLIASARRARVQWLLHGPTLKEMAVFRRRSLTVASCMRRLGRLACTECPGPSCTESSRPLTTGTHTSPRTPPPLPPPFPRPAGTWTNGSTGATNASACISGGCRAILLCVVIWGARTGRSIASLLGAQQHKECLHNSNSGRSAYTAWFMQ